MLREGLFGGGAAISAGTQTVNNGTVIFSNQNGVTFGLSTGVGVPATLTATVNPGPAAGMAGIIAGTQTQTSGSLSFANSNSISFGLSNSSVITASVNFPAQTNQTQASGNMAGIGTTFGGTNVSGSMTMNSNGLQLAISGPAESGVGISAAGSSQSAGQIVFSNLNGVSFGMNGSTITASVTPGAAGGINASLAGNTSGALALVSTGTLILAGGNNITLSQNGNSVTISGPNAGGAQTGISGVQVSNTTYTSGTITFQNANGISFGSSGANGISASYTVPIQTNQTVGFYGLSNTTGQSSSSTYDARSLSFQGAGIISVGNSAGTIIISGPGTTGLTQLSAGMSTGGNTAGTTGLASAQLVLAGGANITLSGSTNGGSMTISFAAPSPAGGAVNFSAGTTSSNLASVVFSNSNGISFGLSGGTITASGGGGGGAQTGISGIVISNTTYTSGTITFQNANGISFGSSGANGISASYTVPALISTIGLYALGNTTQNSSTTLNQSALSFNALGAMTMGYSGGSIQVSAPATSSIVGTNGISISTNGSTISISQISPTVFLNGNTTGQSSSSTFVPQSLYFSGAGGASLGWSAGTVIVSGGAGGGGQTGISGVQISNTTYTSGTITFQNANGISFGSSGAQGISASYTVPTQISTVGLYALGNTTQNSSTTLNQSALSFNGLGAMTAGYSNGSIQLSAPGISSISGTGQVSVLVNGSTISIGVPALQTLSYGFNPYENQAIGLTQVGQASLLFDPEVLPNMQFDRIVVPIYNTNVALSSGSHSLSIYFGLYSRNVSTLSLVGSTSISTAITQSGTNGSYSLYSGLRNVIIGSTATVTSGKYWLAFGSRTSSAGADGSYSNLALAAANTVLLPIGATLSFGGQFGSSVNATNQLTLGQGYYSATTIGVPSSVAFSQINGTASNIGMQQILMFASSTV